MGSEMCIRDRPNAASGPFGGFLVVSMRPYSPEAVPAVAALTEAYPAAHGGPVHWGDPAALGIGDLSAPDFGDAVRVAPLLANLAVLPSGRRQGLGKRLVDACVEIAQDWGYDELLLEVESTNAPAVALYEDRLGFQELWRAPRPALEVDASIASGPPLRRRDAVDHVAMRLPL